MITICVIYSSVFKKYTVRLVAILFIFIGISVKASMIGISEVGAIGRGVQDITLESNINPKIAPFMLFPAYTYVAMSHKQGLGEKIIINSVNIDSSELDMETNDHAVQELLAPVLGKSIFINELNKLAEIVTQYYRQRGYITAQAILPQQIIQDGKLNIKVTNGQLDNRLLINRNSLSSTVTQPLSDRNSCQKGCIQSFAMNMTF